MPRVTCFVIYGGGYAAGVTHDPSQPSSADGRFSEPELQALELADELRDRVQREREVVRRLQEYLEQTHRS